MTKTKKTELVTKFRKGAKDCGSSQVQVALLTERIREVSDHLRAHKKDHHSEVGLLRMVSRRKSLLAYLKKSDAAAYEALIKQLNLRK